MSMSASATLPITVVGSGAQWPRGELLASLCLLQRKRHGFGTAHDDHVAEAYVGKLLDRRRHIDLDQTAGRAAQIDPALLIVDAFNLGRDLAHLGGHATG